jgi:prophage maintenance system killer protein
LIRYLSTHDFVWINNTITGKTLEFEYEALEECMAAQYSYGDSTRVLDQAAFMLHKVLTRRPFAYGNVRTGAVALMAFLTANRYGIKGDDAKCAQTIKSVASGSLTAQDAVHDISEPTELALRPGVTLRTLVTHLLNERREAIRLLTEGDE